MSLPHSNLKTEFIKLFNSLARHEHRYTVFRDFITVSAISMHNAIRKDQTLEEEYLQIIGKYSREDVDRFPKLLGILIELLDPEPTDILGQLYMELELGNDQAGQFFTPPALSELMTGITYGETFKELDKPFITLSDPCCGAGGMVLAFVKEMLKYSHNPSTRLWVQCIDIDRTAAMMCYLQLSLWNIPAQILVGNTLSMKMREQFFTPAHYMYDWDAKLRERNTIDMALELETSTTSDDDSTENEPDQQKKLVITDGHQLDLFDDT